MATKEIHAKKNAAKEIPDEHFYPPEVRKGGGLTGNPFRLVNGDPCVEARQRKKANNIEEERVGGHDSEWKEK